MFVVENPDSGCSLEEMSRGKNICIWSLRATCMSWRVDEDCPMTVQTLYRWVHTALAAESRSHPPGDSAADLDFVIFPIEVQCFSWDGLSHFEFVRFPAARGLDSKSRLLVMPGDYALYRPDGSIPTIYYQFMCDIPFSHWEHEYSKQQPNVVSQAIINSWLLDTVLIRDDFRCVLTGYPLVGAEMDVVWIIPPYMAFLLIKDDYIKRDLLQRKTYHGSVAWEVISMVPGNCLTIRKDLGRFFQDNEVGIDVDDNYRIVFFRGRHFLPPHLRETLKTHLDPRIVADPSINEFLRCHFEQCLATHTIGSRVKIVDYEHGESYYPEEDGTPSTYYDYEDDRLTYIKKDDLL